MPSDWPTATLGELTLNLDTRRKPVKEADRRAGPYPYYGASGIVDHVEGYLFEGEHLLIAEDGENLRTRNTPVAFRATGRFWVNNHAHIVTGNERARTRFLEYAVLAADLTPYLTGAVMPKLTQGNLNKIQIPCPSLSEQDAVIGVLGALDDRIDLLRQTNATLESIAQALFKSWFIDFDPVRAKAEGREPEGMDAATAALLPAEFEESALGLIPEGWRVRRIEELAVKVAMGPFGSNIKVATFVDEGVPVVSGQHLRGTLLEDSEFNFITEEHAQRLSGSLVRRGDIVLTHAGNIGQVALIPGDSAYQTYILSQRQFYLRSNPEVASPEHLAYFLRSEKGQHLLLANASQVGVPSIARPASYLKSIQVVAPPTAVANAFAEVVRATHFSIGSARRRIACLERVRDSLLPRLISGKLRLPEAQAEVEALAA